MYKFICLFVLIGTQGFLSAQEYEFPDKIDDNFVFFKSTDNKIHVLNRSIDYVFEKNFKLIDSRHILVKTPDGRWASDHNPVLAKLKF